MLSNLILKIGSNTKQISITFKQSLNEILSYDRKFFIINLFMSYIIFYTLSPFLTNTKKNGANTKQNSRNFKQSFNDCQSYDRIYFSNKKSFMPGITFYILSSKPDHEKIEHQAFNNKPILFVFFFISYLSFLFCKENKIQA